MISPPPLKIDVNNQTRSRYLRGFGGDTSIAPGYTYAVLGSRVRGRRVGGMKRSLRIKLRGEGWTTNYYVIFRVHDRRVSRTADWLLDRFCEDCVSDHRPHPTPRVERESLRVVRGSIDRNIEPYQENTCQAPLERGSEIMSLMYSTVFHIFDF